MESPFRSASALLIQYARYHRDRRNIALHLVGIPLIVFAICVLLARPSFTLAGVALTPIWVVWALTALWYLTRGEPLLGLVVALLNGVLAALAHRLAEAPVAIWLGWGLGIFACGWVMQAIGHYYEGRRPAFIDDVIGLLVGPMFIVAEVLFACGWGKSLKDAIERSVGPLH